LRPGYQKAVLGDRNWTADRQEESTTMRRTSLIISVFAVMLFGFIAPGRTAPTAAQDATPMADSQGFIGSWQVIVSFAQGPPSRSLGTIDADGTIVASIAPIMPWPGAPGDVLFLSSAHGAWEATGSDSSIVTFLALLADGQGNLFGTATIRASITLDPDGETFSGSNMVTIADLEGTTVATRRGTIQGMRIVAEEPESPDAATPAA
jgi:hypothetical protein